MLFEAPDVDAPASARIWGLGRKKAESRKAAFLLDTESGSLA